MADIRLFLDEDAQRSALVSALRARRFDVLTVNESGRASYSDEEQLEFALGLGRTIFSFNRGHYAQLHSAYLAAGRNHAGIIVSDQDEIGVVVRRLLRLLAGRTAEDMVNWLEYLSNWR